jgi:hypothetical protein
MQGIICLGFNLAVLRFVKCPWPQVISTVFIRAPETKVSNVRFAQKLFATSICRVAISFRRLSSVASLSIINKLEMISLVTIPTAIGYSALTQTEAPMISYL